MRNKNYALAGTSALNAYSCALSSRILSGISTRENALQTQFNTPPRRPHHLFTKTSILLSFNPLSAKRKWRALDWSRKKRKVLLNYQDHSISDFARLTKLIFVYALCHEPIRKSGYKHTAPQTSLGLWRCVPALYREKRLNAHLWQMGPLR